MWEFPNCGTNPNPPAAGFPTHEAAAKGQCWIDLALSWTECLYCNPWSSERMSDCCISSGCKVYVDGFFPIGNSRSRPFADVCNVRASTGLLNLDKLPTLSETWFQIMVDAFQWFPLCSPIIYGEAGHEVTIPSPEVQTLQSVGLHTQLSQRLPSDIVGSIKKYW
jgi:hypothetical protein